MGRPTNDTSMHSIAVLRPDEAINPKEALGTDYLEHLVEAAKEMTREAVGSESNIQSYDLGTTAQRSDGGCSCPRCRSRCCICRTVDRNRLDESPEDPTQCLAGRQCELPDPIRGERRHLRPACLMP